MERSTSRTVSEEAADHSGTHADLPISADSIHMEDLSPPRHSQVLHFQQQEVGAAMNIQFVSAACKPLHKALGGQALDFQLQHCQQLKAAEVHCCDCPALSIAIENRGKVHDCMDKLLLQLVTCAAGSMCSLCMPEFTRELAAVRPALQLQQHLQQQTASADLML